MIKLMMKVALWWLDIEWRAALRRKDLAMVLCIENDIAKVSRALESREAGTQ